MPQAPSITATDVGTAVVSLLVAGEYPTSARLRVALGNKGSPVTIQRLLAQWYAENGKAFAERVTEHSKQAPDTVRARMEAAAKDAIASFDAAQAERVAALEDRGSALDQREADLLAREQALDQRESAQHELIDKLAADGQAARESATSAQAEVASLTAKLQAAHANAVALIGRAEDADALRIKLRECQTELEASQAAATTARKRAEDAERTRDAALANAAALTKQAEATAAATAILQGALSGAKSRVAELSVMADARDTDLEKQRAALAQVQQQLSTERKAAAAREEALQDALQEARGARDAAAKTLEQVAGLRGELEGKQAEAVAERSAMSDQVESALSALSRIEAAITALGAKSAGPGTQASD